MASNTHVRGPAKKAQIGRSENQLSDDFGSDVLAYFKKHNWGGAGLGINETGIANPLSAAFGRAKNQGT